MDSVICRIVKRFPQDTNLHTTMNEIQNFGYQSTHLKTRRLVYTLHGCKVLVVLTSEGRRGRTAEERCDQRRGQMPSSGRFSCTIAGSETLNIKDKDGRDVCRSRRCSPANSLNNNETLNPTAERN